MQFLYLNLSVEINIYFREYINGDNRLFLFTLILHILEK